MKKYFLAVVLSYTTITSPTFAQKPAKPPASKKQPSSSPVPRPAEEPKIGQEIPVFNAENETVEFMGQKFALADNRLADQFSSYLVQTPAKIEEAAAYQKKLREILDILDRGAKGSPSSKLSRGYKLLGEAAKYPQDHRACETLKSTLAFAKQALNTNEQSNQSIRNMKKSYGKLVDDMSYAETRDAKLLSRPTGSSVSKQTEKTANKAANKANNTLGVKGQENIKARAELALKMKKEEISIATLKQAAKWQYQAFLMQLFMQRKFEHCVIGCRFYGILFDEGDNKLQIEKGSQLHKFFSGTLGIQPTVVGLDSMSNEIIGKASTTAENVKNHIALNQIDAATKRMIEAYVVGEHLTSIHTFDTEIRSKLHNYILNSKQLKDAIDVKNWQEAEKYTAKLQNQAVDFRHIKASTAIAGYKNASDLKIAEYKIAMLNEDTEKASGVMEEASKLWPTNPLITKTKFEVMDLLTDESSKLKTLKNKKREFEGIVRNQDYRSLTIRDAGAYQEWFKGARDNEKLKASERDQYRELHDKATSLYNGLEAIETALRTAQGLADRSQHYEAWETIKLELDQKHLEKSRLRDALNEYSSRAVKFHELLTQAESLIESKNYGSALSCYLSAQSLFSKSKLAESGINELLEI